MRCIQKALLALAFALASLNGPALYAADGASVSSVSQGPLASKLQHFVDENVMAGAVVLVADKGQILDLEAVGFSDLATKKLMQTDDLFWIASMTKPITATVVMMLVDEGRLSLDDPIEKYIPEFKNIKVAEADGTKTAPSHPPTLREILCHTSGMGFLNATDKQIIDAVPLEESIRHNLLESLLFQPGTGYKYSNQGIDTAGRIVEIVSGIPFEKLLQDRLLTPLGMRDTTFVPSADQMKRLALSYAPNSDKSGLEEKHIHYLKYPLDGPDRHPAPGGGLFSTARDVAAFCQLFMNDGKLNGHTYLSKDAVREMTRKQTAAHIKEANGLGFATYGPHVFGHGGAYKTNMVIGPDRSFVFLVQQAGGWMRGDPGSEFTKAATALFPVVPPRDP